MGYHTEKGLAPITQTVSYPRGIVTERASFTPKSPCLLPYHMIFSSCMYSYHHAMPWSMWKLLIRAPQIPVPCTWTSRMWAKIVSFYTHPTHLRYFVLGTEEVVIFLHWVGKVRTHGHISLEIQSKKREQDSKWYWLNVATPWTFCKVIETTQLVFR